ncbi:HAMP domain-containing protein, partial [Patescibacteria group bacterium]|nr:HAMP domain-containing protein [Patescibacteria group bacterium]
MRKWFTSLRSKLLLWYIVSLFLMAFFVLLLVHVFPVKNGIYFLILLFFTLAVLGFTIIYKITESLTYLSGRMKNISSKNLDERIIDIEGNDEIGELAITFNGLMDRLHDAFKREQQFIADVAHELKTPLASLRGTLEIALRQKRDNEEYRKSIKEGLEEAHKLSSTLKNVLDLAWSETPEEQKNAKEFNVSFLMEELLETAQKMAIQKKITVSGKIEKDINILGYREKFGRSILNILD